MKKFEGMLICTDLDGTLLRDDKSISKENSEAIEYFKNEGGFFTFITGRMPNTSVGMYEAVKPNAPIGCINGGGIYDFEKREFCWVAELPREALDLVEYVDKELPWIGIQVNTSKAIYFNKYNRVMEKFRKIFDDLFSAIEKEDTDTMKEMMRLSTARRALFDRKGEKK